MESCPSWPKEHDWKSCKRVMTCFKGSNPLLSVLKLWPVGQVVKTPPFHGGNMGSNPVRVTYGGLAQLGERLPYKQRVTGSSPVSSIIIMVLWCRGYHACLSRRRSPVQIRLGPLQLLIAF